MRAELADASASLLSADDLHWFNEGTHCRMYQKLGAHPARVAGRDGIYFAVWAPNAEEVSVIGEFNGWQPGTDLMRLRENSGIWETFLPGIPSGTHYKYHIKSKFNGYAADKADPFAAYAEIPPRTASVVFESDYQWQDAAWMNERGGSPVTTKPLSIYEMHMGSWMRQDDGTFLSYRACAEKLVAWIQRTGFTHVEIMPITEYPFYGSWGYQTTGYFAPTSRFGNPDDFRFFVDTLHQAGIGVILDWVPSHFPSDLHGIGYFDGTHLFEHADPRQGYHPDWKSLIFNYGRPEVRSFLISSAYSWLDRFHVDGLRVDAVASMLYLDYSRKHGEWIPNKFGGRENLEAIAFLQQLNSGIARDFADTFTVAEESTAWPLVSRPVEDGGLGFTMKWDMGWMHDTLEYFQRDPLYRRHAHNHLTFRQMYAYSENFVLPLSHDEVVYGKGALVNKMPGDSWQKFANLRLLYTYMFTQPGKKLLFMSGEIAQFDEWNHDSAVQWNLLEFDNHAGIVRLIGALNRLYRDEDALHAGDCRPEGFAWIDCNDAQHSVIVYERIEPKSGKRLVVALNFTPVVRNDYRIGLPGEGTYREIFNSDNEEYGGGGLCNRQDVHAHNHSCHERSFSTTITLPPLGAVILKQV